jgi:membrane-bound serine protease (ClpP class)
MLENPVKRLVSALLLTVAVAVVVGSGDARAAGARPRPAGPGGIDIVQVEGAVDPVVSDLVVGSLRRAERDGASLVILQVDSPGALDSDPARVLRSIATAGVPVAVWVGEGRATAGGLAAAMLLAADAVAVSPGAEVGPLTPLRLDRDRAGDAATRATVGAAGLADRLGRAERLLHGRVQGQAAVDAGVSDFVAPTLGDLIVGLDGRTVTAGTGPSAQVVKLSTARVVDTGEGPRQTANQPVRFVKLGTFASVQHSLSSPAVAYLLLVVGLALAVFEFFTVGIGLAGLVGGAALAGSFYGFAHLHAAPWAVALVLLSAFGFAVDVQAGHLGFWTGVGVVALLVGSLGLYGGSSRLDVPLWLVVLGVVGQTVFMLGGMTVAVRNRFSVPTVGREAMIGELGEARTDLDPDGVVTVRGAPWRARTQRGRPVAAGLPVRVVAVDRLVLEVEPGEVTQGG